MFGKKVAIGIDLGTTKCCVGVVRDGKVEILENERSRKTTPSYVAFTDTERLIGEDAKDQVTLNPTNTVFGVKRLLGRQFDDPAVQEQVPRHLPFVVDKNERRKPCIRVTYKKEPRTLFPEQITAMLLTKMKKIAQTQLNCPVQDKMKERAQDGLGCPIKDAVISVPASFSNAQRHATNDAATIAGLNVLALINEPTAAAIAYQANRKEQAAETIAVVDFGGGKLEASVVLVNQFAVEVNAAFGCTYFGGSDIDNLIIELLMEKFRRRTGIDLASHVKARERLRGSCEHLKHTLSLLPEARVQLDCLSADTDFNETITRKEFEETVGPKIQKLLDQLHHELSSYVKEHGLVLRKVLLVGGSTRIPLVQRWLEKRFGSEKLDKTVNPDEAVAQGTAVWAALLGGDNTVTDLRVRDVLGRGILMKEEGKRHVLFDQFAPVPAKNELSIRNWLGNTELQLFETKSITADETLQTLATFPCERTSMSSLKFEFSVDQSGICSVSKMSNGKAHQLNNLILETLGLSQKKDMSNMIEDEELFERDTLNEQMRIAALSELESYCFDKKNRLKALLQSKAISKGTFDNLSQSVDDMITWIDSSPSESESFYIRKKLELDELCPELFPKDETALSRRPSSKRSSSANVSARPGSCDNLSDGKGVSANRKSRRDQNNGEDSEPQQRRFASQSAQRSGKTRGESPTGVEKSIGTSGRESRQGRKGEQCNLPKRSSSRGEKYGRTRSLPRKDESGGVRARPASLEPTAAASPKSDEESVRKYSSDRKLGEDAVTGLSDSSKFVGNKKQRHDDVQRNDVGPPKIKPPLLPVDRRSTGSKNRSTHDQPSEDHGIPVVSSYGSSHCAGISDTYEAQSRYRTEVTSDSVLNKNEESVITRNRSQSGNNEFTVKSSSLLDYRKHSSHSREQPTSVVRSNAVVQEEMMTSSPPQTEDSESKQSASFSTEPISCDDGDDICYGYSIERPPYKTRSIRIQTESPYQTDGLSGQSLTVEAKTGSPRDILMVAAGKSSETSDICVDCQEKKSCGCTIAASLAPSNKIRSTSSSSINGVGTFNSSYDPTKYATQSKTIAATDSLQNIPSSTYSTHSVQYSNGTYETALTSPVSRNSPLVTTQDESHKREKNSHYRATTTVASLAVSSSDVDLLSTLNLNQHEENDDSYKYNVNSAMVSRADTRLDSDPVIGTRPDSGMNTDRLRTISSSIRTRSRSRAEGRFDKLHSLNIDPDCVCGSNKPYCSDCRSIRPLMKASAVPFSSVLVRETMTATSSGSNLDANYVLKRNNDALHDELMACKCNCGSRRTACDYCIAKYLLERTATSSGGTNARHLNSPGPSSIVPSPYNSSSMYSHGSSERTQAVYIPRKSSDLTNISFHCVCNNRRTDDCIDCYLMRVRQRLR